MLQCEPLKKNMPLQLAGIICYSISHDKSYNQHNSFYTQVIATRALKTRLSKIEMFSEDGLPFSGPNLQTRKEIFENYLEKPVPLDAIELVHLKLISMSINHLVVGKGAKMDENLSKDTNKYILRMLLSMNYVPSLIEL